MITDDFFLDTARLKIRPLKDEDCESMLRIQGNPAVTQLTPDETWEDIDDAEDFLEFVKWLYTDNPLRDWFRYFFAVTEKQSGNLIGYCGIGNPEFNPSLVEIFYSLDPEFWGRGYATETAKALLEYGFTALGLSKITGFAHPDNAASLRVLEKAGLNQSGYISGLEEKFAYFNGEPFFELSSEQWSAPDENN